MNSAFDTQAISTRMSGSVEGERRPGNSPRDGFNRDRAGPPVEHGLAHRPADWPYSSIHRDIRAGRVEPEWSGTVPDGEFGE